MKFFKLLVLGAIGFAIGVVCSFLFYEFVVSELDIDDSYKVIMFGLAAVFLSLGYAISTQVITNLDDHFVFTIGAEPDCVILIPPIQFCPSIAALLDDADLPRILEYSRQTRAAGHRPHSRPVWPCCEYRGEC